MTMPAPSSAPPPYYPPKRGRGCLWGCFGLLALLLLPIAYGAWFLQDGYRSDPVLRVAGELVRRDGMARLVLGDGVIITGVEGNSFSWVPGLTSHDYDLTLEGAKGKGRLAVTSHAAATGPKIDSAILTGPDGLRYDLLKHMALPGEPGKTDNSI
jgi:hypothetical protein